MHKYSSFYLSEVFKGIQKNAYIGQGAVNAGADIAAAVAPGAATQAAVSKYIPKGIPAGGLKGLGAGLVATTALDAVAPKFNNDSYWGQVGNELRSFGVNTAGSAAGAAAVTGGAAALPGAIQGAAFDVGNKLWRVGSGLNSLFNPYSEHNKSIAEGKERNDRLDKQYRERMANRKPKPPATTAPVGPQTLPPKPPVGVPATTPATAAPIAQPVASTNSVAPASVPPPAPAIPPVAPVAPVAVPPPVTTPLPESSPVSVPSPVAAPSAPSNNLTPKQRMDKATVARVKSQRDRALEYAGLDPKAPPQQFSGFVPPAQQQPAQQQPAQQPAPATPPVAPAAVPPPVTTPLPASSPVSVPAPLTSPSNNLTPKQRMDKITVDRSRAQRDKALEYAGLDPKAPPQQFSGFAPPTQQPTETNSFLPQSNPQVPQPKPVAQPPTGASNPQKFNVVKTPHGTVVGGNVFDKLKAEGKVPKDFQLTKAMRTGEEALPPEIQKAKDEFLRSAKATS